MPVVEHRIELPSSLRVHTIRNLLRSCTFFPTDVPDRIVLSFHPQYSQFVGERVRSRKSERAG